MSRTLNQLINSLFSRPAVAANAELYAPRPSRVVERPRTLDDEPSVVVMEPRSVNTLTSGIHTVRLQDVW